jgi:UDP-glucuronate 4-epimerase
MSRSDVDPQIILVTGAAGFIGSEICRLLHRQGHAVVAIDRHFPTNLPYPQRTGDVGDDSFLSAVCLAYPAKTVVHLAGMLNSVSRQQPYEAMRVNIGASLSLLQLSAQSGVKRFIFGSSISAYGEKPFAAYGAVSELEPAAPIHVYGVSKRYVELVGQDYHQRGEFQFVALRIAMVVGPGMPSTSSPWRSQVFEQLRVQHHTRIDLPFAPAERIPLIHVGDVAAAVHKLITTRHPSHTIYNTPAEQWTAGGLAEYLHDLNGNLEVRYNPSRIKSDPEVINGQRFIDEFNYQPTELRQSLLQYDHGS